MGCNSTSAAVPDAEAPAPKPVASVPATTKREPRCPSESARVGASCVDRWEAALALASDPERMHSPYERPRPGEKYLAVSKPGVVPQAYVNRHEAVAACEAAGKRLCGASEWYRACSGSEGHRYPYGKKLVKNRCNVGKGHLLTKVFGHVTHTYDSHYNNPRVNQTAGFLAKTGEYTECKSEDGAFDMVGNLHEWVADDVSAKLAKELPLEKGDHYMGKRGMGVFIGGYFSSHAEHGHGCLYVTATHAPDYHDYSTGFRCCASPK